MANNYTLYYPTIEFTNPEWLWTAALLWDRVYRIVPNDYKPKDSRNITELINNSDIVSDLDPSKYSEEASKEFIDSCKKETWWAAALDNSNYTKQEYVKLHKDKADVKLRELILAKDTVEKNWLYVPHDMASIYMLFLANLIAKKNDISLSTDYAEAWCGSNFFQHDGNISDFEDESNTQLACITISKFIPTNIIDLQPKDIINLRNNRRQERQRFFKSINELSEKLSSCEDEKIIRDIIEDYLDEIETSTKEFKRSMWNANAIGWMGVKSLIVPVFLPVMQAFHKIPEPTLQRLQLLGLGIGTIGAFWETRTKIKKERKSYENDYLLQLNAISSRSFLGNSEGNIHSGYQQYLNDNLNHFLRD